MFRLKTFLRLIVFSSPFLTVGCGLLHTSTDKTPSNRSSVTPAPRAAEKGASENSATETSGAVCGDMIGKLETDVIGGKGKIPTDFPEPPPGSTLCGYDGLGGGVFYLNKAMSDDEIIKYYEDALRRKGYEVDPPRSPAGEDKQLSFTRQGIASGYVGTKGERDSLSRKVKDFYSVGYSPIEK